MAKLSPIKNHRHGMLHAGDGSSDLITSAMDGMEWGWVLFLLCPRWMVLSFDEVWLSPKPRPFDEMPGELRLQVDWYTDDRLIGEGHTSGRLLAPFALLSLVHVLYTTCLRS